MKKLIIIFLLIIVSLNINADNFKNKKNYLYEEENIEVTGTKKAIKGYPFLFLEDPINVNPENTNDEDYDIPEKNIKILQISMSSKINKIPNGCVILKGYLYHADNANHKTKVLIWTDSYRLCK